MAAIVLVVHANSSGARRLIGLSDARRCLLHLLARLLAAEAADLRSAHARGTRARTCRVWAHLSFARPS